MAVDPVPADPTLNALLVATAEEDWTAWYGCTRLALADYLEERDLPGDRRGADLVRAALPTAWAQCPVRPGWEVYEVRLARNPVRAPDPPWLRVAVAGCGRGDDAFSWLTDDYRRPASSGVVDGDFLRRFPLRALRLSAVIPDDSEVSAGVTLRPAANPHDHLRREDLKLTPADARLWCRREVLGLFADVLVRAPCPHCLGKGVITPTAVVVDPGYPPAGGGVTWLKRGALVGHPGGRTPVPCPVCRGRPPRPCSAPSLLPTLPAVAMPALAPVN